jgi:hypothetical protein
MTTQIKLNGTIGTNYNQFAQIVKESNKFYFVSIQDKITLDRITRAFSKKTLKCFNNTSDFCKGLSIVRFL